jgi:hypothetical protein
MNNTRFRHLATNKIVTIVGEGHIWSNGFLVEAVQLSDGLIWEKSLMPYYYEEVQDDGSHHQGTLPGE